MSIAELERRLDKATDPSVGELITRYGTNLNKLKIDAAQGKIDPTKALMAKMAIDRIVAANVQPPSQGSVFQEQMAPQAPAGLPAVPTNPQMFQGMAGGGIVAMAGGGDVPRYQNRGLVMGYPGFEEDVGLSASDFGVRGGPRSLRNRYEEFYGLQKEFGGEDEEAKLYRQALLKRQAALEGRRGEAANMALLQLGLGMLGTKSPYFFEAAGQSGKEALGQYQASKARQEADELEVAKGLAGLAGRSRAEKLAALNKAYEAQAADERQAAQLEGQRDIARIQAARTTDMKEFINNDVMAEEAKLGRKLTTQEDASVRAKSGRDYVVMTRALESRATAAGASMIGAKATEEEKSRAPSVLATTKFNEWNPLDREKTKYTKLIGDAQKEKDPTKKAQLEAQAEEIKRKWIEDFEKSARGKSTESAGSSRAARSAPPPPPGFVEQP
jgi:hypothetical protein